MNYLGETLWTGQLNASTEVDPRLFGWMKARVSRTDVGSIMVEVHHDGEWVIPFAYFSNQFDPALPPDLAEYFEEEP